MIRPLLLAGWLVTVLPLLATAQTLSSQARPQVRPATPVLSDLQWWTRPASAAAGQLTSAQEVRIPVVATAPVCDGDLSDEVWRQAARLEDFTLMDGSGPPSQQTRVVVCADATHLYLAAECLEENVPQMIARVTRDGGPVWEDDCLEVFVDHTLQRTSFAQIVINSLGKVYAKHPADKSWQPSLLRGVKVEPEKSRWTVELGLPLEDLKLTSNVFGFNVSRERRAQAGVELSCWSPTGQGFGQPDRFGVATLGSSYLRGFQLTPGRVGLNECPVTIANDSDRVRKFRVTLEWQQPRRPALYRERGPLELQPGQTQALTLPYDITTDEAPVRLRLMLKDADSHELLGRRVLEQQVLPALQMTLQPRLYYLHDDRGEVGVELKLSDTLRAPSVLVAVLWEARSGKLLRRQVISPLAGDRLAGALRLGGLPAGSYHLEILLKTGPDDRARRLATRKVSFSRRPGPFEDTN